MEPVSLWWVKYTVLKEKLGPADSIQYFYPLLRDPVCTTQYMERCSLFNAELNDQCQEPTVTQQQSYEHDFLKI
jgi:hypothetical protein